MSAAGAGERNTRQKRAIRRAFELADRPLSTEDVYAAAARESAGLGLATVYRSIRALLDEGWLTAVDVPGRGALFEIAGKQHHHHFVCERCERVYELDGCLATADLRLPAGFRGTRHDITVFGRCAACARRRSNRST